MDYTRGFFHKDPPGSNAQVNRTTNISGALPNRLWTLLGSTIMAVFHTHDSNENNQHQFPFLCKKFFISHSEWMRHRETLQIEPLGFDTPTTHVSRFNGRIYTTGDNRYGQCGVSGRKHHDTTGHLRLPFVHRLWTGPGNCFALTNHGLYGWGHGMDGVLGVRSGCITPPVRVLDDTSVVPSDSGHLRSVVDVQAFPSATFIKVSAGWWVCSARHCQNPGFIPDSGHVTRWWAGDDVAFGSSARDTGMFAIWGDDGVGQCGVGAARPAGGEYRLTRVRLPGKVCVHRVICAGKSTFVLSGRRCFACGDNCEGQLGIPLSPSQQTVTLGFSSGVFSPTPIELPIPVDDLISDDITVIRSGDTLLACGNNEFRQISPTDAKFIAHPTPLDLPGRATAAATSLGQLLVLCDGVWVGRGWYNEDHFHPVDGLDINDALGGWVAVCGGWMDEVWGEGRGVEWG